MTDNDLLYLESVLPHIQSPCLELGANEQGLEAESDATRSLLVKHGIDHQTTGLSGNVDYILDFERDVAITKKFGSVLVLNILEHVFDPIRVLDNCISLIRPAGTCVIIAPCVWPLHYYPIDCWRINPGFFSEYTRRRSLKILDETFRYVTGEKLEGPEYVLPSPASGLKQLWSRGIHKVFNTYGRSMSFPAHVAIGVVIEV